MFLYNRLTINGIDLYLKALHLQPNTDYELSMDIYGGPINIFIAGYGVNKGSGSHYVDFNTEWTHYTFPFSTTDNADGKLSLFTEWGIAFVKKPGEIVPTDIEDTYVDNVALTIKNAPHISLIQGGNFESAKSNAVYSPHWNGEILGMSGRTCGIDIIQDPLNKRNRCLHLPRIAKPNQTFKNLPWKVSCFGWFRNNEEDVSIVNHGSLKSHHLLFVGRGKATLEIDGHIYRASANSLMYLPPKTIFRCTFVKGEGTVYHRIEFIGQSDADTLQKLGLSEPIVRVLPDIPALTTYIDAMQQPSPQSATYFQAISGYLQLLLADLERQLTAGTPRQKHRAVIEGIAQRLRDEPSSALGTAEMAAECGLSECYFITLFKRYMGQTPQQYRLEMLIQKACALLHDTTMSIQEISYASGINDPLYFSRLFRSVQGVSPRDYRKYRRF